MANTTFILLFIFIKHIDTLGKGHVAFLFPNESINGIHAAPKYFLKHEQALGDLYKKAFSFQPPIESFTAILNSIYK